MYRLIVFGNEQAPENVCIWLDNRLEAENYWHEENQHMDD